MISSLPSPLTSHPMRPIDVTNVAVLFAGDGSPLAAVTVAMFVIDERAFLPLVIVEDGRAQTSTDRSSWMTTVPD